MKVTVKTMDSGSQEFELPDEVSQSKLHELIFLNKFSLFRRLSEA